MAVLALTHFRCLVRIVVMAYLPTGIRGEGDFGG